METSIIIAGDFCPQHRVASLIKKGDLEYLYGGIRDVVSKCDYSIINFECPIATEGASPIVKCGPLLKCNPEAVDAISYCGFNAVTLANNHFRDYGDEGVLSTLENLEKKGIEYVGGGKNLDEASAILYKSINGKTFAFINCCENEFSIASKIMPGSNPLSITHQYRTIQKAKRQADYVIVIIHGGLEGCQLPSPRMQDTYRFFVEVGADAVINHHQHCFSGYEYYQDKPICYGLGNFSFDKEGNSDGVKNITKWNEGYMAKLSFTDDRGVILDAIPYVQSHKTPATIIMMSSERQQFLGRIQGINKIIQDSVLLEKEYNKWIDAHSDWYRIIFEPWGKGLRILRRKGLLPSLVSKKKLLSLADYMICETHHDCVKRYFYRLIEKYNA